MPKRRLSKEVDINRLERKIRRLQEKLKIHSSGSDTASDLEEIMPILDFEPETPVLRPSDWFIEGPEVEVITDDLDLPSADIQTSITQPEVGTSAPTSSPNTGPSTLSTTAPPEETALDKDVLQILGDDPSNTIKYGPEIRSELAARLIHVATEGLNKDLRKELLSKYLTPSNSLRIDAPQLNLEIKAALQESAVKRDKGIMLKQKEMACAISGLSEVINSLITSKYKDNEILIKLMDVSKILCDIQHEDSVTRRNFVLFGLKNEMKEHLKNTKIDTFLFGESLAETLRAAKALNKSSAELKGESTKTVPKRFKPAEIRSSAGPKSLNRRAPPHVRRPQGQAPAMAPRSREPVAPRAPPPPPPAHSSRTSAPQTHQRRRF